jgi:hypothetical protein
MRNFPWLATTLLVLTVGCSGFAPQCSTDADCAATSYCNLVAKACFVRSAGSAIPVIDTVTVGAGTITVGGTAQATWTVNIFTNATCSGTPAGTGTADSSGNYSIQATAPATGTAYATAEGDGGGSICSTGKAYP